MLNEGPLRSKASRLAPVQELQTTGPAFTQLLKEAATGPPTTGDRRVTGDGLLWVAMASKLNSQAPYVLFPGVPPAGTESGIIASHAEEPVDDEKRRVQGSENLESTGKASGKIESDEICVRLEGVAYLWHGYQLSTWPICRVIRNSASHTSTD